jgi:hypothetical protein
MFQRTYTCANNLRRYSWNLRKSGFVLPGERANESREVAGREAEREDCCCNVRAEMFGQAGAEDCGVCDRNQRD